MTCRCEPADPHPLCDVHGGPELAAERLDPWLTHYDPFVHGPLTAPFYRHWSHQR